MQLLSKDILTRFAAISFCAITLMILPKAGLAQKNTSVQETVKFTSEKLYQQHAQSIYQIRVINLASNEKTNIGSSFQISPDGYIATNYHVISELVRFPKLHRIEYLTDTKQSGALTVIAFDVINDLAILKKEDTDRKITQYLKLAQHIPDKGAQIFAMGNPHDIGFTILDGTYNGLSTDSLYQRIHFSGSLNSGMSGGPALNNHGDVIGINVSTAGNQISFLVPVEKLQILFNNVTKDASQKTLDKIENTHKKIGQQLYKNQSSLFADFLEKEWETRPFAHFMVPGKMSDQFSCWGGQDRNEIRPFHFYRLTCASDDDIYINRDFSTGRILFRYDHIVADKELSPSRFYSIYESDYSRPLNMYDNGGEEEVTNFECQNDFINIAAEKWRISTCVRQYKKQPRLFDYHLYMALLGHLREGYEISAILQGVSQETAISFQKKFLQNITPVKKKK